METQMKEFIQTSTNKLKTEIINSLPSNDDSDKSKNLHEGDPENDKIIQTKIQTALEKYNVNLKSIINKHMKDRVGRKNCGICENTKGNKR